MKYLLFFAMTFLSVSCQADKPEIQEKTEEHFQEERREMIEQQIRQRGIKDERVLEAMQKVPRHKFVPKMYKGSAYEDYPLPIGYDQTISQPYIVAYMSEILQLSGDEKVLEIGTGSGYQAAVLCVLAKEVYTIEIVEPLCKQADSTLQTLGYDNCYVRCGDGYKGWPEEAPFDAIIVTAAPPTIPQPLIDQLAEGGRMIIPVGRFMQYLKLITKKDGEIREERTISVRFVPMTGEAEN